MRFALPLLLLFFLLLYALLPTANSTIDAYAYALSVQQGRELFLPHHLLYNATGYAFQSLLHSLCRQPDALALLKFLNALAGVGCLAALAWALRPFLSRKQTLCWVLICGSSFGVWRFATEAEAYLLPIFFSVLASACFVRFMLRYRLGWTLAAGLLAAVACLFHQVQVWWWMGLLFGVIWQSRRPVPVLTYLLPALIVPAVYALVLIGPEHQPLTFGNLWHFTFRDFYSGSASASFGLDNIVLTGVNFIRTFFQVHGVVFRLLDLHLPLISHVAMVVSLLVFALLQFWYLLRKKPAANSIPVKPTLFADSQEDERPLNKIRLTHLLILILQLAFAAFAVGNAEFMAMLPFALALTLAGRRWTKPRVLLPVGLALLCWNLTYGILPNFLLDYRNRAGLRSFISQHPKQVFVLTDEAQLRIELEYFTGNAIPVLFLETPSAKVSTNKPLPPLHQEIRRQLQNGNVVYTDAIEKPEVLNRAAFLSNQADREFFAAYQVSPVLRLPTFFGDRVLHRVQLK